MSAKEMFHCWQMFSSLEKNLTFFMRISLTVRDKQKQTKMSQAHHEQGNPEQLHWWQNDSFSHFFITGVERYLMKLVYSKYLYTHHCHHNSLTSRYGRQPSNRVRSVGSATKFPGLKSLSYGSLALWTQSIFITSLWLNIWGH